MSWDHFLLDWQAELDAQASRFGEERDVVVRVVAVTHVDAPSRGLL